MFDRPAVLFRSGKFGSAPLAAAVLAASSAGAQKGPGGVDPTQGEPCCQITAIVAPTGLVTAREGSTGKEFQFRVPNKALLATLRAGQKVWADFGTNRVATERGEPCCPIIRFLDTRASGGARAGKP